MIWLGSTPLASARSLAAGCRVADSCDKIWVAFGLWANTASELRYEFYN